MNKKNPKENEFIKNGRFSSKVSLLVCFFPTKKNGIKLNFLHVREANKVFHIFLILFLFVVIVTA